MAELKPLKVVAKTLHGRGLGPESALLDFLRRGELTAVIRFPDGHSPSFPVPVSEWRELRDEEFRVRWYRRPPGRRKGGWRTRHQKIFVDFAVEARMGELGPLLEAVVARNLEVFREAAQGSLPIEIHSSGDAEPDWLSIHRALMERAVDLAKQYGTTTNVYVQSDELERFLKVQGRGGPSRAGRKRLAEADQVWVEALRHYKLARPKLSKKALSRKIRAALQERNIKPPSDEYLSNILGALNSLTDRGE